MWRIVGVRRLVEGSVGGVWEEVMAGQVVCRREGSTAAAAAEPTSMCGSVGLACGLALLDVGYIDTPAWASGLAQVRMAEAVGA